MKKANRSALYRVHAGFGINWRKRMDQNLKHIAIALAYNYALDMQAKDFPKLDGDRQFEIATAYALRYWEEWSPDAFRLYTSLIYRCRE